jgi:hypothetical protein
MSERNERSQHSQRPVFGSHFLDPDALERDDPESEDAETDRPDSGEPEPGDPGQPAAQEHSVPAGSRIGAAALDLVLLVATVGWRLRSARTWAHDRSPAQSLQYG